MKRAEKIMAAKVLAVFVFIDIITLIIAIGGWYTFANDASDILPAAIAFVASCIFLGNHIALVAIIANLIRKAKN